VLMARITPCLENGKTAVVDMLQADEVAWGSTEFIVLEPVAPLSTAWTYCLVRTDAVRSFAIRNMTGTSGRQRFPAAAFDGYLIDQPDAEAVTRFNELAVPSFSKMAQLRDESLKLAELRDTLMPELVLGRLRVPEAPVPVGASV
jgi:type I restriction enzyme, S subunit